MAAPSAVAERSAREARVPAPERCRSARLGVAWYRLQVVSRQDKRIRVQVQWGLPVSKPLAWPPGRRPRNCADARYLAEVWRARAFAHRKEHVRFLEHVARIILIDTPYGDGNRAWFKAVDEVQPVFPGSKPWMLSCSWAEGRHGRWVVHGGGDYYAGAEYAKGGKEVGGNMQYTYGTFKGHFRRGLEYLLAKGYRVPQHLHTPSVTAWQSALGQAIAAGAAHFLGLRGHHWSASHGNGC